MNVLKNVGIPIPQTVSTRQMKIIAELHYNINFTNKGSSKFISQPTRRFGACPQMALSVYVN